MSVAMTAWRARSRSVAKRPHAYAYQPRPDQLLNVRGFETSIMRSFDSLSEREILALAISLEEEDGRIYGDFAENLREAFPSTAEVFKGMKQEEIEHHGRLTDMYRQRFGEHVPLIRKQDVKGFVKRRPVWLYSSLKLDVMRKMAESLEAETRLFYQKAAARTTDLGVRQLLLDLAEAERGHIAAAERLTEQNLTDP